MSDLQTIDQDALYLQRWSKMAVNSGIMPDNVNQHQAMAIIQTGKEIGVKPFQALRMISFIKGKLCMEVKLQLALAKQHGVKVRSLEDASHECKVTLVRDDEKVTCTFSLEDAKRAGLVRAGGSYEKYERQMLRWRAIGDALRIIAPDLTNGLLSPEEANTLSETIIDEITMPEAINDAQITPDSDSNEKTGDALQSDAESGSTAHSESGEESDTKPSPRTIAFRIRMQDFKQALTEAVYREFLRGVIGVEKTSEINDVEQQEDTLRDIAKYCKELAVKVPEVQHAK